MEYLVQFSLSLLLCVCVCKWGASQTTHLRFKMIKEVISFISASPPLDFYDALHLSLSLHKHTHEKSKIARSFLTIRPPLFICTLLSCSVCLFKEFVYGDVRIWMSEIQTWSVAVWMCQCEVLNLFWNAY